MRDRAVKPHRIENPIRRPLDGITVVELGTVIMVPMAAQLLGDLGARVVRVESRETDPSRVIGGALTPGLSGVALNLHRNKESICLDLKSAEGLDTLKRILRASDVFLSNLRVDALTRLKLDSESVLEVNPRLIYCISNGFFSESADASRPAFDDVIQAEVGLVGLTSYIADQPRFIPTVLADKVTALYIVNAVLAGLLERNRTARGMAIEVPMFDTMLAFTLVEHLAGATVAGGTAGYQRILSGHRGPHKTKDGFIALLPYSDAHWRALYEEAGRASELSKPAFRSHQSRVEDPDTVYASLAEVLAARTTEEWMEVAARLGIPAGQINDIDSLAVDDELHRGVISYEDHPVVGPYRHVASPFRFDGKRLELRRTAPEPGEDSGGLLREFGDPGRIL